MTTTRVVLVDDHAIVRTGLKAVIADAEEIEVVGEASGGDEAIALLARVPADVVVMDISMSDGDGLSATRSITRQGDRPRVLVLTMHAEEAYLEAVLQAGASGYLVKSTADRELVDAIRAVARGEVFVQPAAARVLAQGARRREEHAIDRARFARLTDRERAVMQLIAEGYTAPDIGEQLAISPKTVDTYKQRINDKLGLAHRADYVKLALKLGLLQAPVYRAPARASARQWVWHGSSSTAGATPRHPECFRSLNHMLTQLNLALERLTGRRLSKWQEPRERFFKRLHELHLWSGEAEAGASLDDRFARFVSAHMRDARAQFFQDLWVLFELAERRDGYFVEFGASDGQWLSNSWLLEQQHGWTGILAEPNPVNHPSLTIRHAALDTRCVYAASGTTMEFHATDNPVLSTLAQFSDADFHAATRQARTSIMVETVSLDDLLDQHHAPPVIDYLSVDTEGSEFDILAAYSFRRHVRCISVEHNFTPARQTIDRLLRDRGYVQRFPYASQADSWYVHERDLAVT